MAFKSDALQKINSEAVARTSEAIPCMTVEEQAKFIDMVFIAPTRISGNATSASIMSVLADMDISPKSFRETLDMCPDFRDEFESYEALMIKDLGHSLLAKASQLVHDENPMAIKVALDIAKQARALTAPPAQKKRQQLELTADKPKSRLQGVQVEDEDEN